MALMLFMGVYPGAFVSRARASIEATRRYLINPQAGNTLDVAIKTKQDESR
jgi:hypothetical protein